MIQNIGQSIDIVYDEDFDFRKGMNLFIQVFFYYKPKAI